MTFLEKAKQYRVIAIVRGVNQKYMPQLSKALCQGGIHMIEIAFDHTSEAGMRNTLESIRILHKLRNNRQAEPKIYMEIGAGTVLHPNDALAARQAGAEFIITPNVNRDVIAIAKEYGMGTMPGAFTPTEVEQAWSYGADIVKIFPACNAGVSYIHNLRGPLGHIPLAAVGGIGVENIRSFLEAGCICAGVGGSLIDKKAIETGNWDLIRDYAAALMEAAGE